MKLFFCDICNESIPLQDIKENRSTTIKGKIFCRQCNPLNELPGGDAASSSSTSTASTGGGLLALMSVLLILVLGGLCYVIYELKMAPSDPALEAHDETLEGLLLTVSRLNDDVAVLKGAYERLDGLGSVPGEIQGLQEEVAALSGLLTRQGKDVSELQEGLVAVGRLRERIESEALRQEELGQEVGQVLASLESLRKSVMEIGARPPVIVATGDATEETKGEDGSEELPDEGLDDTVAKLEAEDPMARWEAVDQIRRLGDKALVPHVIPLLDDRDTFVRAQAIYTLGELKAMPAVPKLIKLLRDDEIMIREEALNSLMVITGQNYRFDVAGSRSVREAGIRKWETWVSKNSDKF